MSIHQITGQLIKWLNAESKPSELPLCDFERFRYELRPCDVILVEGRSRVSSVIRLITASPWTHAALYIGRIHDIEDPALRESLERYCNFPPNEQLIIESVLGKGTIVNKLSFYTKDHIRICRPSGLSYKDAQQVIRYAISRLGAGYDVRQIFDLARFLFPWILLPRRWRSSLFRSSAGDSTRTVCSTMIAEAFGFIQFPILPLVKKVDEGGVQLFRRNPKICVPSDFDYSPHFEIIKYPFIDLGLHKDYRLLPWKGSGQLSREEARLYFEHREEDNEEVQDSSTDSTSNKLPEEVIAGSAYPEVEVRATLESEPVAPPKETLSPLKRVVNTLSWRDIGSTLMPTAEPATEDPTPPDESDGEKPTAAQNEASFDQGASKAEAQATAKSTAKAKKSNKKEKPSNNDTKPSAKGQENPETGAPGPPQTSDSGSTASDASHKPGTDSETESPVTSPATDSAITDTPSTEDTGDIDADLIDPTSDGEIKTEAEASAVEKWLRSITTGRPKSED